MVNAFFLGFFTMSIITIIGLMYVSYRRTDWLALLFAIGYILYLIHKILITA